MEKKHEPLKPSDAVLLAVVAAVPFIVLGGIAIGIDVLSTEAAAAWAQAIGSFVALGIAIWVPHRIASIDKAERREVELRRARIKCRRLRADLGRIEGELESVIESVDDDKAKGHAFDPVLYGSLLRDSFLPDETDVEALAQFNIGASITLSRLMNAVRHMSVAARAIESLPSEVIGATVNIFGAEAHACLKWTLEVQKALSEIPDK